MITLNYLKKIGKKYYYWCTIIIFLIVDEKKLLRTAISAKAVNYRFILRKQIFERKYFDENVYLKISTIYIRCKQGLTLYMRYLH